MKTPVWPTHSCCGHSGLLRVIIANFSWRVPSHPMRVTTLSSKRLGPPSCQTPWLFTYFAMKPKNWERLCPTIITLDPRPTKHTDPFCSPHLKNNTGFQQYLSFVVIIHYILDSIHKEMYLRTHDLSHFIIFKSLPWEIKEEKESISRQYPQHPPERWWNLSSVNS